MIPYGRQHIDQDDIDAVAAALKSDYLTTGPLVDEFEKAFCKVTGAKYAVACSNGTTALHLACMASGLGAGDWVIVPSVTFLATANAVRYCGADVFFCDVDPETGILTPEIFSNALEQSKKQGKNVKAVMPVHLAGRAANLDEIKNIAEMDDIKIIADSCHAVGGLSSGHPVGSCRYEDFSTFSFHPTKTIAMGEGGAVTTNDEAAAVKMKSLRHHGMVKTPEMALWQYEMPELGYNYRLTDIQCALGISQLKKLSGFVKKRATLVDYYNAHIGDISPHIKSHVISENRNTAWHLYSARIDFNALGIERHDFMAQLKDRGIGTQVHYIPVHSQPYYKNLYGAIDLSGAKKYYETTLSLPLYPLLEQDDIDRVLQSLSDVIKS